MSQNEHQFSTKKIASLASLDLSADEASNLQSQMADVLEFIDQIETVDLTDVEPYFGPPNTPAQIRDDTVRDSLTREEVLKNAPQRDDEFYLVPPVFG